MAPLPVPACNRKKLSRPPSLCWPRLGHMRAHIRFPEAQRPASHAAGLLRLMKNEDELAAVLAHECAHVVARHGAERMSQAQFLQVRAAALRCAVLRCAVQSRRSMHVQSLLPPLLLRPPVHAGCLNAGRPFCGLPCNAALPCCTVPTPCSGGCRWRACCCTGCWVSRCLLACWWPPSSCPTPGAGCVAA